MNDWIDLFRNIDFYDFAIKESGHTESFKTLERFGDFLINHNLDFHNFMTISVVWDLMEESDRMNIIALKFDAQDYSKMFLIMDFLNKFCIDKKMKFDAELRSRFIFNVQAKRMNFQNVELVNGEGEINDNCLYEQVKVRVSNILGRVSIMDDAKGYNLLNGAVGKMIQRGRE